MVMGKEKAGTSVIRINSRRHSLTSTKKSKGKTTKNLAFPIDKKVKKRSRVSSIPNQFTHKFYSTIEL